MSAIEKATRRIGKVFARATDGQNGTQSGEYLLPKDYEHKQLHIAVVSEDNPSILTDVRTSRVIQMIVDTVYETYQQDAFLTINLPATQNPSAISNLLEALPFQFSQPREDVPNLYQARITGQNYSLAFTLKFGFDGRAEVVRMAQRVAANGGDITLENASSYKDLPDLPDPDFKIYTGQPYTMRFNNDGVWEQAYTEFDATQDPFVQLTKSTLQQKLYIFTKRARRFGGLNGLTAKSR